jgi:hypothetical protein
MTLNTEKRFVSFLTSIFSYSTKKWEQGLPVYTSQVKEGVYKPRSKTANRKMQKI